MYITDTINYIVCLNYAVPGVPSSGIGRFWRSTSSLLLQLLVAPVLEWLYEFTAKTVVQLRKPLELAVGEGQAEHPLASRGLRPTRCTVDANDGRTATISVGPKRMS